jgi:putative restriction endonuclease
MTRGRDWTRMELLVALSLYVEIPFGRLHARNPIIVETAQKLNRTPDSLAMKLTNFASLDPAITESGRSGLKGASALDRRVWAEMQADWQSFFVESNTARASLSLGGYASADESPDTIIEDSIDYTSQSRFAQARIRIGQSGFRKAVLSAYELKCCITGLSDVQLLVASHIIPWRDDEKNRLNPRNGLCLSSIHDKAFDKGLITFSESRALVLSSQLRKHSSNQFVQTAFFAYEGKPLKEPSKFRSTDEFLRHHRTSVFVA